MHRWACKARLASLETQVSGAAARLTDLPAEVLGLICRPLSLKDRVCLSITCRALLQGLADSEDAWGTLEICDKRALQNWPLLLVWLAHRRRGLRYLQLNLGPVPQGDEARAAAAQLAACLESSPLVQLQLTGLALSEHKGDAVLQWLGSCTALTSLTLTMCELRCLPAGLELLPALAELGLPWNNLAGANWGQLQQMTALTRLEVNDCELAALPAELASLPALVALDVEGNERLGAAAEGVWAPLAQCSRLTSLNLGAIPMERLPPALAALAPNLVDLNLRSTDEDGLWAGGEATLGPLFRLTGLTRLNLCNCFELHLPEELSCLVALQDLDLGYNEFLEEGLPLHPLRHFTALTRLSLREAYLLELPEEISHLQTLKDLDLGRGPEQFMLNINWRHFHGLTALTRLDLTGCNLEQLPPELAELHSLADLNLSHNIFLGVWSGDSAAGFAAKWAPLEQLTGLTCLDASLCELHAVPAAFGALPRLRDLKLGLNTSLGRTGVRPLRALVRMTALQHLDLSGCSLPPELEVDAIPFPLHRLKGWAERIKGLSLEEIQMLRLGVCLYVTCRTLLHALADSKRAWAALEFCDQRACEKWPLLLPWLAHRRQGLRRLALNLGYVRGLDESRAAAAQLAACLEGSPLVQFQLTGLALPGDKDDEVLQRLGSCAALTSVTLSMCELRCLPAALELLPALAELSLPWNRFAETNSDAFYGVGFPSSPPPQRGQLQRLTALTRLDISNCQLVALPPGLPELRALAALNLQGNWLATTVQYWDDWNDFEDEEGEGDAAEDTVWPPLAQCSSLTFLMLGAISFEWLPPALAALAPGLVELDLRCTGEYGLWVRGEAALGPLFSLTGLTRLILSDCEELSRLPEGLSCLMALQDLDLSNSRFLEEGLPLRPLRHLDALTRLNLSGTYLKDLPEELSHLQSLKNLSLGHDPPHHEANISWLHLRGLTALTRLDICGCNLERLPAELAELLSLEELDLSWNRLGGSAAGVAATWAALEQLTGLTRLDASSCELHAVPAAFAALSGLRELRLANNPDIGRSGVEALRTLVRMTALRWLDLSWCSLPLEVEEDAIPFPLHRLENWTGFQEEWEFELEADSEAKS